MGRNPPAVANDVAQGLPNEVKEAWRSVDVWAHGAHAVANVLGHGRAWSATQVPASWRNATSLADDRHVVDEPSRSRRQVLARRQAAVSAELVDQVRLVVVAALQRE